MILRQFYPPDVRVDKEMRMLLEGGHRPHLLCFGQEKEGDHVGRHGIPIRHLQPLRTAGQRRLDHWRLCFTFRSAFWEEKCLEFARDFSLDALHVHDLPLVGTAYSVASELGIPVVADLHENYPSAVQNYYDSRVKKAILYGQSRWTRYETEICSKVAKTLVVVEESKDRLVQNGVPCENIAVVPNASHPDFASQPLNQDIIERYRERFVIGYVGAINTNRDLESTIRAVALLRDIIPSLYLLIVGSGPEWHTRCLDNLVAEGGVQDIVEFTGWKPFSQVPSYIAVSAVCMAPARPSIQAHASGPHKVFQYWMMRKPVVVSDCASLRRIAHESNGALVFEAGNARDLARVLESLYRDPTLRDALGESGHQMAVSGKYSWQQTAETLSQVYRDLES